MGKMKVIQIKMCAECPACHVHYFGGASCELDDREPQTWAERKGWNLDEDRIGESPPKWCPLRQESLQLELGQ